MKPLYLTSFWYLLIATTLSGTISGCGAVRYQQVVISVRNELTDIPIQDAYVSVQILGEMGRANSGRVPLLQDGYTNEQGDWQVTVPMRRGGQIMVDSLGYERRLLDIEGDLFQNGKLEVKLMPCASVVNGSLKDSSATPDFGQTEHDAN